MKTTNALVPYFRLEDSLCRRFLELARGAQDFEGMKLLFPFVREMSVLRFPRTPCKVAFWMQLAFMAGHDLGRAYPDRIQNVLPGLELREAVRRVGVLQYYSGEEHSTFAGLYRACAHIAQAQWGQVSEENLESTILEVTVKSLRTGFAAGTACQVDPLRCDFVWDIPERIGQGIQDIVSRAFVGAARQAVGQPVLALLEHPLLRLANELYPARAVECESMRNFLREELKARGVQSEDECPTSELDLVDWIAAGINYGRKVKAEHPEILEQIFSAIQGKTLVDGFSVVQQVVAVAGGTDPVHLLGPLKCWQQGVYGWSEPGFYGEELARVVYFSDFAVWIPWVCESADNPRVGKRQNEYPRTS